MKIRSIRLYHTVSIILIILNAFIASCDSSQGASPSPPFSISATSPATLPAMPPTDEIIQPPYSLWIDPAIPASIVEKVSFQSEYIITPKEVSSHISFSTNGEILIGDWFFLAVMPFNSPIDSIQIDELLGIWQGMDSNSDYLYVSQDTYQFFSSIWEEPDNDSIVVIEPDQILLTLW